MTKELKNIERIDGSTIESNLIERQLGFESPGDGLSQEHYKLKYKTRNGQVISFIPEGGEATYSKVNLTTVEDDNDAATKKYVDDKFEESNITTVRPHLTGFVSPEDVDLTYDVPNHHLFLKPKSGKSELQYYINGKLYTLKATVDKKLDNSVVGHFYAFLNVNGQIEYSQEWKETLLPLISGFRVSNNLGEDHTTAGDINNEYLSLIAAYNGTAMDKATREYHECNVGTWIEAGCLVAIADNKSTFSRSAGTLVHGDIATDLGGKNNVTPAVGYMADSLTAKYTIKPSSNNWLTEHGSSVHGSLYQGATKMERAPLGEGVWYLYFARPDMRSGEWSDIIIPVEGHATFAKRYKGIDAIVRKVASKYIDFIGEWKVMGLLFLQDDAIADFIDLAAFQVKDLLYCGMLERTLTTIEDDQNLSEVLARGNDAGGQGIVGVGKIGIGTDSPEVKNHIKSRELGIDWKGNYSHLAIEATDAHLDLVSSEDGTWGSAIHLKQVDSKTKQLNDSWSIVRKTSINGNGDGSLRISNSTNKDGFIGDHTIFYTDGTVELPKSNTEKIENSGPKTVTTKEWVEQCDVSSAKTLKIPTVGGLNSTINKLVIANGTSAGNAEALKVVGVGTGNADIIVKGVAELTVYNHTGTSGALKAGCSVYRDPSAYNCGMVNSSTPAAIDNVLNTPFIGTVIEDSVIINNGAFGIVKVLIDLQKVVEQDFATEEYVDGKLDGKLDVDGSTLVEIVPAGDGTMDKWYKIAEFTRTTPYANFNSTWEIMGRDTTPFELNVAVDGGVDNYRHPKLRITCKYSQVQLSGLIFKLQIADSLGSKFSLYVKRSATNWNSIKRIIKQNVIYGFTANYTLEDVGITEPTGHEVLTASISENFEMLPESQDLGDVLSKGNDAGGQDINNTGKITVTDNDVYIKGTANGGTRKLYIENKNSGGGRTDKSLGVNGDGEVVLRNESAARDWMKINAVGAMTLPEVDINEINSAGPKAVTTKEYVDSKVANITETQGLSDVLSKGNDAGGQDINNVRDIDNAKYSFIGDTDTGLSKSVWSGTSVFGKNGTSKVVIGHLNQPDPQVNGAIVGAHTSALNAWDQLTFGATDYRWFNGQNKQIMSLSDTGVLSLPDVTNSEIDIIGNKAVTTKEYVESRLINPSVSIPKTSLQAGQEYFIAYAKGGGSTNDYQVYSGDIDITFSMETNSHHNQVNIRVTKVLNEFVAKTTNQLWYAAGNGKHCLGNIRIYKSSDWYGAMLISIIPSNTSPYIPVFEGAYSTTKPSLWTAIAPTTTRPIEASNATILAMDLPSKSGYTVFNSNKSSSFSIADNGTATLVGATTAAIELAGDQAVTTKKYVDTKVANITENQGLSDVLSKGNDAGGMDIRGVGAIKGNAGNGILKFNSDSVHIGYNELIAIGSSASATYLNAPDGNGQIMVSTASANLLWNGKGVKSNFNGVLCDNELSDFTGGHSKLVTTKEYVDTKVANITETQGLSDVLSKGNDAGGQDIVNAGKLSSGKRGERAGQIEINSGMTGASAGSDSPLLWTMLVGGGSGISHLAKISPSAYQTIGRGVHNELNFYVGEWNNSAEAGGPKLTLSSTGAAILPNTNNSIIETAGDKAVTTKEYVDTNYMGSALRQTHPGLVNPNGDENGWTRTTAAGLIPYTNGGNSSSLGTDGWPFKTIYGKSIYENGISLSKKYAGISPFDANSCSVNLGFNSISNSTITAPKTITGAPISVNRTSVNETINLLIPNVEDVAQRTIYIDSIGKMKGTFPGQETIINLQRTGSSKRVQLYVKEVINNTNDLLTVTLDECIDLFWERCSDNVLFMTNVNATNQQEWWSRNAPMKGLTRPVYLNNGAVLYFTDGLLTGVTDPA